MKGWPSCLPVMVMAVGPGLRAGMSACHEPLFLPSVNVWLSMLADSRMGAVLVSILSGLPALPCLSRFHVNTSPCLLMAVILLPVLAACVYCWFPVSARMSASPGFQAQSCPFLLVIMAWSSLAAIWLALVPSGKPTGVTLASLSARYQGCPFESKSRNPLLKAWTWTVRISVSCLMCTGLAFLVLLAFQVQVCPSASTMRAWLAEATALTVCAFPGRLSVACSVGFGFGSWLSAWLVWEAWTCPCRSTAKSQSLFRLMLVNPASWPVSRIVGVASWLFQV